MFLFSSSIIGSASIILLVLLTGKLNTAEVRIIHNNIISDPNTNGTEESFLISEVSLFQRLQEWYIRWEKSQV